MASISLKVLQSDRLPCDSCGGKCCELAPFSAAELRTARVANGGRYPLGAKVMAWVGFQIKAKFGGGNAFLVVKEGTQTCAFLVGGKCSIYEARPIACREYGRVPKMPCMVLHPKEALAIGRAMIKETLKLRQQPRIV